MRRLVGASVLLVLAISTVALGQVPPKPEPPPPSDLPGERAAPESPPPSQTDLPAQVLVLLPGTDRALAEEIARRHALGVGVLYPIASLRAVLAVLLIPDGRSPAEVAQLLRRESQVLEADVNSLYQTQSDPLSPRQYAIGLVGAARVHGALLGRKILIAIVDTGIDAGHEDLIGAVFRQINLIEEEPEIAPAHHGTALAGIIAARKDNGLGMTGVAPEARLLALRACMPKEPAEATATCTALRVARALDLAIQSRAHIINLSLGGARNNIVTRLIQQAMLVDDVIVVAAAGNNGPTGPTLHPAALPGVVSVGATDHQDRLYAGSNRRSSLVILAPGVDLLATLPANRYAFVTGTSYAAAAVSGSLALLLEGLGGGRRADVIAALKMGAAVTDLQGVGRVDLCRSLALMGRVDICR